MNQAYQLSSIGVHCSKQMDVVNIVTKGVEFVGR